MTRFPCATIVFAFSSTVAVSQRRTSPSKLTWTFPVSWMVCVSEFRKRDCAVIPTNRPLPTEIRVEETAEPTDGRHVSAKAAIEPEIKDFAPTVQDWLKVRDMSFGFHGVDAIPVSRRRSGDVLGAALDVELSDFVIRLHIQGFCEKRYGL